MSQVLYNNSYLILNRLCVSVNESAPKFSILDWTGLNCHNNFKCMSKNQDDCNIIYHTVSMKKSM